MLKRKEKKTDKNPLAVEKENTLNSINHNTDSYDKTAVLGDTKKFSKKEPSADSTNSSLPRILMVTNALNAGGAETHIISLVKGLVKKGYFVIVASSGGFMQKPLESLGVPHIYAPLSSKLPSSILKSAAIIKRTVKKHKIDIVHSHSRLAALSARLAVGRLGSKKTRFVTTAHLDFSLSFLKKKLGFWGEKTIAVSEDIRGYLIDNYKLSYENIMLTVNGIDTEKFSPDKNMRSKSPDTAPSDKTAAPYFSDEAAAPSFSDESQVDRGTGKEELLGPSAKSPTEDAYEHALAKTNITLPSVYSRKKLVHISRLDKDRAYTAFLLCDIIGMLYEKWGVTLAIIGSGGLADELSERVELVRRLYGNIVELVGEVEDPSPFLKEADAFVGVSRAALEAMSTGVPTILSGNCGFMGIYRSNLLKRAAKTNFCCRGEALATKRSLFTAIDSLFSKSDEELDKISDECRQTVIENYSLDKMVNDYISFYEGLRPFSRKSGRLAVIGYHGFSNLGDEAILSVILKELEKKYSREEITVFSENPEQTAADFSVNSVLRSSPFAVVKTLARSKILVVGGGTLLQADSSKRSLLYYFLVIKLARLFGNTVVFWSNGMARYRQSVQPVVASLYGKNTIVTVRDEQSKNIIESLIGKKAEKYSVKCYVTADPAFLLGYAEESRVKAIEEKLELKRYFVVATNGCIKNKFSLKILASAVLLACEKGYSPLVVVMQKKKDMACAKKLRELCQKNIPNIPIIAPSFSEASSLIAKSEFVISQRLHALIFAAKASVPSIAFTDNDKCKIFAKESFGREYTVSLTDKPSDALNASLIALIENREAIKKCLSERLPSQIESAKATAEIVFSQIDIIEAKRKKVKYKRTIFRKDVTK